MNSTKPRIASAIDRARLARLTRSELEHCMELAKRALQAFGASDAPRCGVDEEVALEPGAIRA